MKYLIGFLVSFLIGAGCRFFDVPAPCPPLLPGALLVVAMTLGYGATDRIMNSNGRIATTKHLDGGPSGLPASASLPRKEGERL